jgi:hypothetical protein
MYHEASICNLMEVMLYHRTACESSEDALVELIDYCYRKFVNMTHRGEYYSNLNTNTPAVSDAKAYMN